MKKALRRFLPILLIFLLTACGEVHGNEYPELTTTPEVTDIATPTPTETPTLTPTATPTPTSTPTPEPTDTPTPTPTPKPTGQLHDFGPG